MVFTVDDIILKVKYVRAFSFTHRQLTGFCVCRNEENQRIMANFQAYEGQSVGRSIETRKQNFQFIGIQY